MRRSLVEDLLCPISGDPLRLEADAQAGDDVGSGWLVCDGCGRKWAIRDGIPRLVPPDLAQQQQDTASAFGWQWQHFAEFHPEFEEQFLDWLHPIDRGFFAGKRVQPKRNGGCKEAAPKDGEPASTHIWQVADSGGPDTAPS